MSRFKAFAYKPVRISTTGTFTFLIYGLVTLNSKYNEEISQIFFGSDSLKEEMRSHDYGNPEKPHKDSSEAKSWSINIARCTSVHVVS